MLNQHRGGEYIFLVPGRSPHLPPAPQISAEDNPYRGLSPYEEKHRELFFGREEAVAELLAKVIDEPLTVVLGASGTGKSSLVLAGLLPRLREPSDTHWHILTPLRPLAEPMQNLLKLLKADEELGPLLSAEKAQDLNFSFADLVASWRAKDSKSRLLLVVDQLDELFTLRRNDTEATPFQEQLADALRAHSEQLHVVTTLRSDLEPYFTGPGGKLPWSASARFLVPPLSRAELREVILKPAETRVLYFDPPELVEKLVDEVAQMPGALPLLSFALSEMYAKYISSRANGRALTEKNYLELGGVIGSFLSGHQAKVNSVAFSYDRKIVASAGEDQIIRLWSLEPPSAAPKVFSASTFKPLAIVFQSDSKSLLAGDSKGVVRRLALEANAKAETLRTFDFEPVVELIAAGQDGSLFAVAPPPNGLDPSSKEFDIGDMQNLNEKNVTFKGSSYGISAVAIAAKSRVVATGSFNTIHVWNLGQPLSITSPVVLETDAGTVTSLAVSPDGRFVASGHIKLVKEGTFTSAPEMAMTIYLWDLRNTKKPPILLGAHEAAITSLQFSPDASLLASGSEDRTARVWDLSEPGATPIVLRGHDQTIKALAFSPDGAKLVTGSSDGSTRLWSLLQPDFFPLKWNSNNGGVISVAYSPDGKSVASGYMNGEILVWAADTASLVALACGKVRRNLTVVEWSQFVGTGVPYEKTCEALPPGS